MHAETAIATGFELRFEPLFCHGSGFSFPCDARGQVDLDRIGERARCNYFYARSLIGRDFGRPAVRPATLQ
jgi:hypothetical protein